MKKLTRKSLNELAQKMPILSEELQRSFIGGGDGTKETPYTQREYDAFVISGYFPGGYVNFGGGDDTYYIAAKNTGVLVTNGKNSEYNPYRNGDSSGQWSMMFEGGYKLGYEGGFWNEVDGNLSGILYPLGEEPGGNGGPQWDLLYKYRGFLQGKEDRERNFQSYY